MKPDKSLNVDMDAAIDRAVRSIMSAEPRPGMRQRVLARINETPRRGFPIVRLAIVGGSLAAIALAVALRVGVRPIDPEEHVVAPPPAVTAAPLKEAPAVQKTPEAIAAGPAPGAYRRPTPSQPVPRGMVVAQSLVSPEDDLRTIDAATTALDAPQDLDPLRMPSLDAIQSIVLSSAAVPAITMPSIGVSKLQEIAPLQSPNR